MPIDFRRDDVNWDQDQNFHIYEDAERAKGDGGGFFGPLDQAAAASARDIRLEKARMLDHARRDLIRSIREKQFETFPVTLGEQPIYRSVDGIEDAPDASIKF